MSRERKTVDVWRLYVDYGLGWERELTEYSPGEARKRRKEYTENCPQYPTKIVEGREPVKKYYFYGEKIDGDGNATWCGLLRAEKDPTGKYGLILVYGRSLDQEEKERGCLVFIREEEKK